jgi:hypothetical protein
MLSIGQELDWEPKFDNLAGFKDSYENDYLVKKSKGELKPDFECDEMVLGVRGSSTSARTVQAPDLYHRCVCVGLLLQGVGARA